MWPDTPVPRHVSQEDGLKLCCAFQEACLVSFYTNNLVVSNALSLIDTLTDDTPKSLVLHPLRDLFTPLSRHLNTLHLLCCTFCPVYCCLLHISLSMQTPVPTLAHCYSGNEMEIKATNCTQTSDYGDNCKAHPTPALILHSLHGVMPFCSPG